MQIFLGFLTGCISAENDRIAKKKKAFWSSKTLVSTSWGQIFLRLTILTRSDEIEQKKNFPNFWSFFFRSTGTEIFFQTKRPYGTDSSFIQLQFHFLSSLIRPIVAEISEIKQKRTLMSLTVNISATNNRTAKRRTVLETGKNFQENFMEKFQKKKSYRCTILVGKKLKKVTFFLILVNRLYLNEYRRGSSTLQEFLHLNIPLKTL